MNGEEQPYMYHVGLDSHDLKPVLLDDVLLHIEEQKRIYDTNHSNLGVN